MIIFAMISAPAVARRADSYFYGSVAGLRGHHKFTHIHVDIYDPSAGVWASQPNPSLSGDVWGGSIAFGYGVGDFRAEIDLSIREEAHVNNATIKSDSLTAIFYFDLNNKARLTPFVGAGIGGSRVKLHIKNLDVSGARTNFAAMGTAGFNFRITDGLSLNLAYRRFYFGHVELTHDIDVGGPEPAILKVRARDTSSEVLFGASYRF